MCSIYLLQENKNVTILAKQLMLVQNDDVTEFNFVYTL